MRLLMFSTFCDSAFLRLTGNSSHHEQKLLHVVAPNGTNDTREEEGNNTHLQTDRDDSGMFEICLVG